MYLWVIFNNNNNNNNLVWWHCHRVALYKMWYKLKSACSVLSMLNQIDVFLSALQMYLFFSLIYIFILSSSFIMKTSFLPRWAIGSDVWQDRQPACSGSVVVTTYDFESGWPGSNPEWGLIYYKASITAHGLPEPSFLRGSTLGTRTAGHKGCNWACKLTDCCSLKGCVRPHLLAYAAEIKVNSTASSTSVTRLWGAQ